jgi:hypothetical protein
LAAEVEILVSLASELFSEQGHPGKLSKYMDTSNLGWIHQVHKKQTVQPSSQVEQTKVLLTSKLCERPVGGNLLELSMSLEGSTRLGRSRALLRPRLCAPCTVSGWRKTPPPHKFPWVQMLLKEHHLREKQPAHDAEWESQDVCVRVCV